MLHRHRPAAGLIIAAGLLLQGCQPMPSPLKPDAAAVVDADARESPAAHEAGIHTATEWPLRFTVHNFGAHCFDTQSCEILYRGFPHGSDAPSPSVSSYGRPLESLLSAGRGPIPNFPPPARVTWRSKDGTPLTAEVDIGEIFKDELVRHNVARGDVATGTFIGPPNIILVVDDRTVRVYMRARIPTKDLQKPGNQYSDFRADLTEAYSRSY